MIPPNLDAFRKLMERSREMAYYSSCDALAEESERVRDKLDADALAALATATPEQLLGIVGKVDAELYCDLNRVVYHITQREGA